jgi:small subunit ribosomal protein S5
MTEENTNTSVVPTEVATETGATTEAQNKTFTPRSGFRPGFRGGRGGSGGDRGGRPGGRGGRGAGGRPERQKPEFEQKMIDVRRVTRVVSGGRRFSFSVAIVVGDRKGHVGFGIGKSGDTSAAIDKAYKQATKKMITLRLNKNFSIPYDVKAKFNTSKLTLMPNKGRGLIAGSSARAVLSLAGVKDITAKFHSGSKNKLNNAKVTMEALKEFSIPFERSHKPKEDRTEGVRKFLGRDGKAGGNKFGGRPGGFRKKFVDRDTKEANPNTEKAIDKISL